MNHQYARAERLLTRPFSTTPPKPPDDEAAHGLTNGHSGKGKGREQDLPPPPLVPRLPMGPGGMIEVPEDMQEGVSRLVDLSVACRYLAAQCQVRQGNWAEATEMLGESNPFRESGRSGPAIPNVDGGIKVEASMCYLRGILMQKLNRGDSAKECYMEALALDVKCYDAFLALIDGELLTVNEGELSSTISDAVIEWQCRVGFHPGPSLQGTNARRRRLRAADVHVSPPEI